MCQALRELMKDEIEEEIQTAVQTAVQAAEEKAVDQTLITSIKNLMKKFGMDAKTVMDGMGISATDQLRYLAML